jgi:hypothetical protein
MKKVKYLNIESLQIEFNKRFPESNIVLLEFISERIVKIKDDYGICHYPLSHILHEGTSSILKAVNKNEYFKNQANIIHNRKYNYSLVNYENSKSKIEVICPVHGKFKISPVKHLCKQGCRKCGYEIMANKNISNTKEFINKCNLVHKNNYDYSLVEYITAMCKIKIICKKHGEFEQVAYGHLSGGGCSKCKNNKTSIRNVENPTGWTYTNWEKSGLKSKTFDSFKVYILECWNREERFYKIGKTYNTIKQRFNCKTLLPYNYRVLKIFSGNSKEISNLEIRIINMNKNNKYFPKIKFKGMYECFKKLENYEEFFIKK